MENLGEKASERGSNRDSIIESPKADTNDLQTIRRMTGGTGTDKQLPGLTLAGLPETTAKGEAKGHANEYKETELRRADDSARFAKVVKDKVPFAHDLAGTKLKEKRSPAEIAHDLEVDSYKCLRESHNRLKITTDNKEARELAPQEKHVLDSDKTAMQIGKDALGPNASDEQLKFYADLVRSLNDLKGLPEDKIPKGTELKLPGQRKDGGLYGGTPPQIGWSDGSSLVHDKDGSIRARYTDKDGYTVSTHLNTVEPFLSFRTRERDEQRTVEDAFGKLTRFDKQSKDAEKDDWQKTSVEYLDDDGNKLIERYKPGRIEASSMTIVLEDKSTVEGTLGSDGDYHGVKKDKDGKPVDNDMGITADGVIYSRKFIEDPLSKERLAVKSYPGLLELVRTSRASDGHMLKEESKDGLGRKQIAQFDEESKIKSLEIIPDKGPRITLSAAESGGIPRGEWLGPDGKTKIGTVELGPEYQLIFKHDKEPRSRIEYSDGRIETQSALPNGGRRTVRQKDKESVTVDTDFFGATRQVHEYENGRKVEMSDVKDKKPQSIQINDENKCETKLTYNRSEGVYKGVRKDSSGKEVEDVTFDGGNMLYKDRASGKVRAEIYDSVAANAFQPPSFRSGDYDHNLATLTIVDENKKEVSALPAGRTDMVDTKASTVKGKTDTGRESEINSDGSALVRHRDGSGARLDADSKTITIFSGGFDGSSTKQVLSKAETDCLKDHKDIDRRDLIEIHRRYAGNPESLGKIYDELKTIDTAKNLSAEEKSTLRMNLMRHIAFPQEISQHGAPTCAVTVAQRNICMTQPDRYIKQVVSAVSDGKVNCAAGKPIDVNPDKMKMLDSSGRDLVTRIFQNSALSSLYHPRLEFQPTEDGVGRFYKLPRQNGDKPSRTFAGLGMEAIAELEYKLTGVEKTVLKIDTLDDLVAAFKQNGERPMPVGVDTNKPPFSASEDTAEPGGHVVTIIGFTNTDPPRILFANQWGLHADHSENHRSVDARTFMDNLKSDPSVRIDGRHVGLGEVIVNGNRKKAYRLEKGAMVEDTLATEALTKKRKKEFGE